MSKIGELRKTSELVGRAYKLSKKAHRGQKRASGEPYFNHALETAECLASWDMDEETIAAGLLHDSVEDTSVTLEEVRAEFGEGVALLVDGVTKLGVVKYRGDEKQIANLSKLILSLAEDLRVILIKLADRRHNMRTLDSLPKDKQKRIAAETLEIYAPIAYRLGMQELSGELQDLAFPYVYPKEYQWLNEKLEDRYTKRIAYLKKLRPKIEKEIKDNNLTFLWMDFRAKRHASLYKKLQRYDMDLDKIHDLVAFRIIVGSIEDCYAVLGLIHKLWHPLPGRIKDYIASPKPNGYQSLHTTVLGPDNKTVEFQIRTEEMHNQAEYGIAAHWSYKEGRKPDKREVEWVRKLRHWQKDYGDFKNVVDSFKIDFLNDRILVLTPSGEVVDLPKGATPVDFAYNIHTEVGDTCTGATVNDKSVPLDYKLSSGEVVEIRTQKKKKPSAAWLDFVVSGVARNHIRNTLRRDAKNSLIIPKKRCMELKVKAVRREDLVDNISEVLSAVKINVLKLNSSSKPQSVNQIVKIVCDTDDEKRMKKAVDKVKKLGGIKEVGYRLV